MQELTSMAAGAAALPIPQALQPRLDDTPLVERGERALGQLGPYGGSSRVDPRFRAALQQLVLALRGLEGLRVLGVGGEAVEAALEQMGRLLEALEPAAAQAVRELEAERAPAAGPKVKRASRSARPGQVAAAA